MYRNKLLQEGADRLENAIIKMEKFLFGTYFL